MEEVEGHFDAVPKELEEEGEDNDEMEDGEEELGVLDGEAEELLKMAFKPWAPDLD